MNMKNKNIYNRYEYLIRNILINLSKNGEVNFGDVDLETIKIGIEPNKDNKFGDYSTNIAMVLRKQTGMNPQKLGELIASKLKEEECISSASCDSCFVNFRAKKRFLADFLHDALDEDYGKSEIGKGKRVNVEYVSANPTGPLHGGHARGAVLGDVVASLLEANGYDVTREYYVNDYGKQVKILVETLYERYLEALGEKEFIAKEGFYPGEYLKDIAKKLVDLKGDSLKSLSDDERYEVLKKFAVESILQNIKKDMEDLGIHHDKFTSETDLVKCKKVQNTIDFLRDKGHIYQGVLVPPKGKVVDDWEPSEQTLFKTKEFGDDIDRPLLKSDGSWTYFASDIAYHLDKIERGYDIIIDFFGADHGGYIKRMEAAIAALSSKVKFKILLCQLVKFMEDGKEVRMSKRAGNFITLRDIIDEVGADVLRFSMLMRKSDSPLDFDFKKAIEQSKENPIFYIQYAHARTCSILKQFRKAFPNFDLEKIDENLDLDYLDSDEENNLIKSLLDYPRQVIISGVNFEPQKIAFYLYDLASIFHNLWNLGKGNENLRFVSDDNLERTKAKIWLVMSVKKVIALGLGIIGIKPLEEL